VRRGPKGDAGSTDTGCGEGVRAPGDARDSGASQASAPVVSMILMAVFVVGGCVGLVARWPAGPANLDWGVWTVVYGGYAYVVLAALFHARTGR